MTTDELNAIVQAVMLEMEKAGVDFDFKAEVPQPTDLVYVMRGTADKYLGITVKWQNLLDIIVKKATDAKDEAVSAKDIALQTLATIQGIESNVSSMKSSVETTKGEVATLKSDVATMKASVETSEANVTQMKSDVSTMKTSVEGTKTEVEGLKSDVTTLKSQTQTIVDNAKKEVEGLLDTKVDKSSVLTYDNIIASTPPMDLDSAVASASALKHLKPINIHKYYNTNPSTSYVEQTGCRITIPANCIFGIRASRGYNYAMPKELIITYLPPTSSEFNKNPLAKDSNDGSFFSISANAVGFTDNNPLDVYIYAKDFQDNTDGTNTTHIHAWYITL